MSIMEGVSIVSALATWTKQLFCKHWYYCHTQYLVNRVFFVQIVPPLVITEWKCAKCGKIHKDIDLDRYKPISI